MNQSPNQSRVPWTGVGAGLGTVVLCGESGSGGRIRTYDQAVNSRPIPCVNDAGISHANSHAAVESGLAGLAPNRIHSASAPSILLDPGWAARSHPEGLAPMPGSKPGRFGTDEERFWRKVDKSGECWEWTGSRSSEGWHGRMKWRGRMTMTHRIAWEIHFGHIPDGLFVLHACDNPPCVNPAHLMLGTHRANMIDAGRKGRMGSGKDATHCKRGHPFAGNTYIHPVTGRRSCATCISLRNRNRPHRLRPGTHQAVADDRGRCQGCGEELLFGNLGGGRTGWRHSRWAA